MTLPHNLRAPVNPNAPEAPGVCDRCGFLYPLADLQYQHEYLGEALVNLRRRVCPSCMDVPNEQLRPRVLPPDPVPVEDPRPAPWAAQEGPPPPPLSVRQIIGD